MKIFGRHFRGCARRACTSSITRVRPLSTLPILGRRFRGRAIMRPSLRVRQSGAVKSRSCIARPPAFSGAAPYPTLARARPRRAFQPGLGEREGGVPLAFVRVILDSVLMSIAYINSSLFSLIAIGFSRVRVRVMMDEKRQPSVLGFPAAPAVLNQSAGPSDRLKVSTGASLSRSLA